jgi:predicted nuclease of predicted toxin-antitoxin system
MFKLLVDEDLPRSTAAMLKSLGIDALDLRDIGLKGAPDAEVFKYAQNEGRIIITRDVEFGNILKYPIQNHCGIIIVRIPNTYIRDKILEIIRNFFLEVDKNKLMNSLVILEAEKYRIRPSSTYGEVQDR